MLIISWNMGCGPRSAKYRRTHDEALRYLLETLRPDIAFVQEAMLFGERIAGEHGTVVWSADRGRDSGTGIIVRPGIDVTPLSLQSQGNYVAAATINYDSRPFTACSVHVGPKDYRQHLVNIQDSICELLNEQLVVVGGDFNAARHWDTVHGGNWYTNYFLSLLENGFHDCHWGIHGREIQSFWGQQAKAKYQKRSVSRRCGASVTGIELPRRR